MIDLNKLVNAKRVVVETISPNVSSDFVKDFRNKYNLTQLSLANILGVTKKTVEKWEQGKSRVSGSSAILLTLLNEDDALFKKVYSVQVISEQTTTQKY